MTSKQAQSIGGGLFLIALGAIFLIPEISFWPWMLVAIAISQLPSALFDKFRWYSLQSIIWLAGIAILFHFGVFWPGVLFVIGASAIVGAFMGDKRKGKREEIEGE